MVNPSRRSRSKRRVYRRTPGAKVSLQFKKRKPSKAKCAQCGKVLTGVARERAKQLHKMPKTQKRPERPFGGMLCSACMRRKIITNNRSA